MTHKLTADGAAVVAPDINWLSIDKNTPIGVRMMLIEKSQGVAYVRTHFSDDGFDHWFPLPTFKKD
jgi:hypothetical protein